ncbi:MAG: pyruvate kinase [Deltaproteobacteria bacterium]|nr:MAG: pyruvate kinase [Deltaproteobacteria bacterium]
MVETGTKIVATLGPASWDEAVLTELVQAGLDVARINASHSDHEGIRRQVARVRRVAMRLDEPVAVLLDLQGPKIRLGKVEGELTLAPGDLLTVVMDPDVIGAGHRVGTTYPEMAHDVKVGEVVLFADGALIGEVAQVRLELDPPEVDVRIEYGGVLTSNKGLNLPDTDMSVPSLTAKDRRDLEVGLEVGVDYVALSFVRDAPDLLELIEEMDRFGRRIPIIAKIEKPQAVRNLGRILDHCEAVMVARGDLGVEVPIEQVPVFQKQIIRQAAARGALVITATQMLDSMERNPRPTRAETTDVANAILDGTDAVMLSGETSVGLYPREAVATMDRIARQVEASAYFRPPLPSEMPPFEGLDDAMIRAAAFTLRDHPELPLVVFTWSGQAAIKASKMRHRSSIFALSPHPQVVDQLKLAWGITPMVVPPVRSIDDLMIAGEQLLVERGRLRPDQEYLVLAGRSPMRAAMHLLKLRRVGDVGTPRR